MTALTALLTRLEWAQAHHMDLYLSPEQCAEVSGELREVESVLRELEWSRIVRGIGPCCPICDGIQHDGGHEEDCKLAALAGGTHADANG